MTSATVRVAIVGGGIAGLTFAVALAKTGANVDVDIYESTASFGEIGAGIVFLPRILDDLRFLGFGAELESQGEDEYIAYRKGDEPDCKVWGGRLAPFQGLRRADFLDALLKHLPATYRPHFGKRLASYTDSAPDPIVLNFKDGSTATCDILVGADGLKSATRKAMFEKLADAEPMVEKANALRELIEPKWAGQYIYKNLISKEKLAAICPDHPALGAPAIFTGKRKYIVAYPLSQVGFINISAVVQVSDRTDTLHDKPWSGTVPQAEVKDAFAGWSPYAQSFLDCVAEPSRWVINCVSDLPTFVSGRVAIIGDAAHAMTPHLGSGAGQAIEDGMLLATLLAQPQTSIAQIPTVLKVFDEVRRPFAQEIARKSFHTGTLTFLCSEELKEYSAEDSAAGRIPVEVLKRLDKEVAAESEWCYKTFAKDDREKAVELYQARSRAQ